MMISVYGDRVRSARTLRRLKSQEVAAELRWPGSRQTRLEYSEKANLDPAEVEALSKLLDFPERYFQEPPPALISADDLLFRAPVATPKKEKAYLAEFARSVGEVLEWLDTYHRLPPVKLPSLPDGLPVSVAAAEVRRALGVAEDQPITHLTHRLERAGVPVVMRGVPRRLALHDPEDLESDGLTERHLGYSVRIGEHADRPISVIRSNPSWERVRWTVAHEIGHLALHGRVLPINSEEQANIFASELLVPASVLRNELSRHVTLASLTEVKLRWGISLGALIIHLRTNDLIDQERFETLRRQLYTRTNPSTGRTWGKDEPGWDAWEVERPRLLMTWMERCLGFSAPHAISQISRLWPADLIASMVSGQRQKTEKMTPGSSTPQQASSVDNVISLDRWRREA